MEDLTRRFLEYSLRHSRPVKLVWMAVDGIRAGNVTVRSMGEETFDYVTARSRNKPQTMRVSDVLSASFARGDDGNPMNNMKQENGNRDGE